MIDPIHGHEMEDRYWLSDVIHPPQWREVTKEEYVRAERRVGFHNTQGQPDEPATASFGDTDTGIRGTTLDPFFGKAVDG